MIKLTQKSHTTIKRAGGKIRRLWPFSSFGL